MTFQRRLRACVEGGNLTVADLARWFDRPYPTVRCWLHDGWEPAGGPVTVRRTEERLRQLEAFIKRRGKVLAEMPMHQRAHELRMHT
jgi:hypothetical protein